MKNDSITVPWPALPLGEPGWRTRLESLAERSEALIGRKCGLSKTAEMALELCGLLWPVLGAAETVAATCRASLLVGAPGIVAASSAADQLAEVHARLDAIWQQAQGDPAAGLVELPPPVMNEIKPVPYELAAAVEPAAVIEAQVDEVIEPAVEPAAAEWANDQHAQHLDGITDTAPAPAEDPDELPPAWQAEPEPIEPAVVWLRSDDLAAALSTSRSNVAGWNGKGLFAGLTRPPARGEGRGERFNLLACRAAYEARPSRRNRNRPKPPAPMPVTIQEIEPQAPAVEPSAPEPTPEAAADAAALVELARGDAGTLAALRALLLVPVG